MLCLSDKGTVGIHLTERNGGQDMHAEDFKRELEKKIFRKLFQKVSKINSVEIWPSERTKSFPNVPILKKG